MVINLDILKNIQIKLLLLLLFITFQNQAQELLPFVKNYSKSDYLGDNQTWNVAQGKDAALYFANNHYLLRYDGVKWEKNSLPNKTIIRSLLVDDDLIYTGSYKEFGYWYRKNGKMHYVSISNGKSVFAEKENEEIWKIFKFKGNIYFQTFNEIFIYNGKTVKKTKLPFLISYCFEVDNQIFMASVRTGVYQFNNSRLTKVKKWAQLDNNVIHHIEKYKNTTYFFTKKNGVFIEENGKMSPWKSTLNQKLKVDIINTAQFIKGDKLIIGTGRNGLYYIDLKTNAYQNINRDNVLMNNSVLSVKVDREGNLWLGLDNGIAHVEINSPISIFYDNSGALGSVYSVVKTAKGYLLASNHGVFKYEGQNFSLIPNSQGQALDIYKISEKYIIGHNEGTFVYENEKFYKLNDIHGGWNFVKSSINDSYIQSNYSGIRFYKYKDDLSQNIPIKLLLKPIRYVGQINKNDIWAADNYRGLYRVSFNDDYVTTKIENITQKSNIKKDFGVRIFEFRNELLFLIHNTWYTYNSISNQLVENKLFNSNFKNVTDVVSISENHFLILQNGMLYEVFADDNKFIKYYIQEKYYRGKIINDNLKVFKYNNTYLLNLEDGFISLQLKKKKLNCPKLNLKVEFFNEDKLVKENTAINHNSELRAHIISGLYGEKKPSLFYKLDNEEVLPVVEGEVKLNNLDSGNHTLRVYRFNGLDYKEISLLDFKVAKPWYFSFWMIVFYLIILGTVLYLYYKWNKMRYLQKLKLQEEELKHQKEILEMELKSENELNSQEYEKHILELELQTKSSEVAGKSLSIAKQSEMIENIQEILNSETDISKLKNDIKKVIKINSVNKQEWENFETNLNQIHNDFIIKLTNKFPHLTPKDINLCIYLKMNLSSKEIAPLMNISYRGVEIHRYRLRKKLKLSKEINLTKFLLLV